VSGGMYGASESPCAARDSLQLWLTVRYEQAKAVNPQKSGTATFLTAWGFRWKLLFAPVHGLPYELPAGMAL